LTGVRNTLEDIDRAKDVKLRNKLRRDQLVMSMNKSKLQDLVSADYASVPTILPKLNVTDVTGIKPGLSLTYRGPRATLPKKGQMKKKLPPLESMPSMEMRSKAENELSFQSAHESKSQSILSKSMKVKLKPIEKSKKYEIMEGRSTHMDIVNYIDEVGDKEKDKFYYCVKGRDFYEYYVCHFEELNKETADYITISVRGVTHFVNKEAEFLSLLDWKSEVENYQKVACIPFFKNFRIRKNFNLWDRLVKETKMIERGLYLNKELFLADSQLNRATIDANKVFYGLVNADLLQVVSVANSLVE
jgi:hypothetical protein